MQALDHNLLADPRSKEKIAETRMTPENTRRVCCSPGRKPASEPFDDWAIRFEFPIMLISLL